LNESVTRGKPEPIRVVFFDAGETLVHPYPSFMGLFESTCTERGMDVDTRALPAVAGGLLAELDAKQRTGFTFSTSHEESHAFWLDFYLRLLAGLGISEGEELADDLYRTFSDPANYVLYEDVFETLQGLEMRGLNIGLISNFEAWLEGLLERLGILGFFRHLYISGQVGKEKPHHDIFDMALKGAGVEAHQAMHVGDSLSSDINGARAVGLIPVMIDRMNHHQETDCIRLTDLRQLLGLLDRDGAAS
jgi:putative hydrolase of the HAD superfamily